MKRHSYALVIVLLLLLVPGLVYTKGVARLHKAELSTPDEGVPLYLPSIRYVRMFTFGFERTTANILWFSTLNYFGKQLEQHAHMPWFGHMCDLVTELDPRSRQRFEFCSTLLSWVADEPRLSEKLLSRAIDADPEYWRYYYLRGFNRWYFLEDQSAASSDFITGAKKADAPSFMASLGSRLLVSRGDTGTAIRALKEMIDSSESEDARRALQERLTLVYISRDIKYLDRLVARYRADSGEYPKSLAVLAEKGLIKGVPLDPFRKPYRIDAADGTIRASNGSRGLEFAGKTARTGLAKNERLRKMKRSAEGKSMAEEQGQQP